MPTKKTVIGIVVIVAILAAGYRSTSEMTSVGELSNPSGTVRVSGAWALYPMMVKWAEEFQKAHPGVRIDVSAGGAGKGMADALGELVDIGMVSREIFPSEIEKGAFWVACTKDAVIPTVNEDNPVLDILQASGVKREIFEGIWITEKITTWGEVVGTNTKDRIDVYTRSDACGAAKTWVTYLGNYEQEDLKGVAVYGDPGLAEAVRKDPVGVGYNNLNFAYDPKTGKPVAGLVIIPLDLNGNGVVDENEDFYNTRAELVDAIATGVYPSPPARELNLVTKNEFTGVTKEFVEWVLTDGQQYVSETGYIPLPQEKIDEELEKLG